MPDTDTPKLEGRPPKYSDPIEFEAAVNRYFDECDNTTIIKQVVQKGEIIPVPTPKPYTMAGLARALEIDRRTLNNYKANDNLFPIISRARERIHEQNVTFALLGIHDSRIANLNLASNFDYVLKTQTEVDATVTTPEFTDEDREAMRRIARQAARRVIEDGKQPLKLVS